MPEAWEDYFIPSTAPDGTNQYNVLASSGIQYAGVPIAVGDAPEIVVFMEGQKVNEADYTFVDGILTPLVTWPSGANIEWLLLSRGSGSGAGGGTFSSWFQPTPTGNPLVWGIAPALTYPIFLRDRAAWWHSTVILINNGSQIQLGTDPSEFDTPELWIMGVLQ